MAKTKATKTEKRVRMSTRRSANFTHHEKQVLLSLMQEYRHIVEDRHTDGVTVREKNTAWIDLTDKYNAESDVSSRSVKQLRQCWKNLKSRSRVDFLRVLGEPGTNDSGALTLVPQGGTSSSSSTGGSGSGNALTLVTVGGISNSTNANEVSGTSPNNTSSIDNAGTIILNNILTNNSNDILHNGNNINNIRPTNGIASGDLSPHPTNSGLATFGQSLPSSTASTNRQRPESKTSSSNKKRKKKTPNNRKGVVSATTVAVDDGGIDVEVNEVSRVRRKNRPSLVHLDFNENGVLEDGENVAEMERPRRKIRPSVMHLDYDVSTTVDDEDDDDGAVVADEDVSDRLQVNVGYPHDSAVVVSQQGHSQEPDDIYAGDTLAVVSVSGSADRIHFNNHASSPVPDDIHHHHPQSHGVNLHSQSQSGYRLSHHSPDSPPHLQIQPSSFQQTSITANSNHLEDDLNHTAGSEHDIKVFDSIRGFGKVLHAQDALPTHLVSHVTDGRTVHSVNIGPSLNYSDEVDIVNNVPSSHAGAQILSTHGANNAQIPSIEPVLLEKVSHNQEHDTDFMDFRKTEHSEKMKNIRLERKLIGVEHKARMELIKLKSDYVKMKMQILLNDRS